MNTVPSGQPACGSFPPIADITSGAKVGAVTELSTPQHLGRLLIAALVCSAVMLGMQFLPTNYEPSRPLYMFAWLASAVGAYIACKRKNPFVGAVARMLAVIFMAAFVLTLFIRN